MLASDYMDYRKLWLDLNEFLHQKTAENSHSAPLINSILDFMYTREQKQSRQAQNQLDTELMNAAVVDAKLIVKKLVGEFMESSSAHLSERLEKAFEIAMGAEEG